MLSGNKCGHNKISPVCFIGKSFHKKRPLKLDKAKRHAKACYTNPFEYDFGKNSFHVNKLTKNKYNRQKRSENRSFLYNEFLQVLLHYTCLSNMQIGIFNAQGKFIPWGLEFLVQKLQENIIEQGNNIKINYERARRVLNQLKEVGYISIKYQHKRLTSGKIIALPSIITVGDNLFKDLGVNEEELKSAKQSEIKYIRQYEQNKRSKEYNRIAREEHKEEKQMRKYYAPVTTSPSYRDFTGISKMNDIEKQKFIESGYTASKINYPDIKKEQFPH